MCTVLSTVLEAWRSHAVGDIAADGGRHDASCRCAHPLGAGRGGDLSHRPSICLHRPGAHAPSCLFTSARTWPPRKAYTRHRSLCALSTFSASPRGPRGALHGALGGPGREGTAVQHAGCVQGHHPLPVSRGEGWGGPRACVHASCPQTHACGYTPPPLPCLSGRQRHERPEEEEQHICSQGFHSRFGSDSWLGTSCTVCAWRSAARCMASRMSQ